MNDARLDYVAAHLRDLRRRRVPGSHRHVPWWCLAWAEELLAELARHRPRQARLDDFLSQEGALPPQQGAA